MIYDEWMQQLIEKGKWDDNVSWEFYYSDQLPPTKLCTAVFCLAIHNQKIILMRAKRGWGMLGGHIEDNEAILETLTRECEEEGGFTPQSPHLFGFRKMTAENQLPNSYSKKTYPFPTSYIVYYWSESNQRLSQPKGKEVLETKAFDLHEVDALNTPDLSTIQLGWKDYCSHSL